MGGLSDLADISEDHADHRVRLVRSPKWRSDEWLFLAIGLYHSCKWGWDYILVTKHMLNSGHSA